MSTHLQTVLDSCPTDGGAVDNRVCHHCHWRDGPNPDFGVVACGHDDAQRAPDETRNARSAALKAAGAGAAPLYAGPVRGRLP